MRTVNLSTYPIPLSAVCLGTARFGGEYDESRSFDLLDRYYDMGGRFLDTANVYGRWSGRGINESELTIGRWLKTRKIDDMVITSKCVHWAPEAPSVSRVNRDAAMRDLDESRRSLGLDTIPIYLTHRDDPSVDVRVIVDFMAEMVEKGYVTRFGFSNYTADRVKTAVEYMGGDWRKLFVGVSNEWSLHEEASAAENGGKTSFTPGGMVQTDLGLWKLHREMEIPLIPFSASAHGFYAKVTDPDDLSAGDRKIYSYLREEEANTGVSVNAVSVAYILNSGVPAIPVVGVSSEKQLREFDDIARWERDLGYLSPFGEMKYDMKKIILSADGYAVMYLVPDEVAAKLDRYCTEFCTEWIWHNPNGAKLLRESNGRKYASYTEKDFIEYLNEWIFPDEPSVLVKEFGCYPNELPKEYRKYPTYNF